MLNRILPLLLLLSLLGCRKNELINQVTYEEEPPKVLVVSSFQGKVVDENGDPIKDAQVIVYFSHTTTDENGRSRRAGLILLGVSLLAGVGMAFAAASTIVSSNGPQDATAVVEGQQSIIPPGELLNYGG